MDGDDSGKGSIRRNSSAIELGVVMASTFVSLFGIDSSGSVGEFFDRLAERLGRGIHDRARLVSVVMVRGIGRLNRQPAMARRVRSFRVLS